MDQHIPGSQKTEILRHTNGKVILKQILKKQIVVWIQLVGSGAHPAFLQWVPGVKRPGCEADYSPPSSAEVKNACNYTFAPPINLYVVVLS
jgi:hypothetical protein